MLVRPAKFLALASAKAGLPTIGLPYAGMNVNASSAGGRPALTTFSEQSPVCAGVGLADVNRITNPSARASRAAVDRLRIVHPFSLPARFGRRIGSGRGPGGELAANEGVVGQLAIPMLPERQALCIGGDGALGLSDATLECGHR